MIAQAKHEPIVASQILLIEDEPFFAKLLSSYLEFKFDEPYELQHALTLAEGLALLGAQSFDILLLDLSLSDSRGLTTLKRVHSAAPGVPIVVLTGNEDEEQALEALRIGAQDYLFKTNFRDIDLIRSIRYTRERAKLSQQTNERKHLCQSIFNNAPLGMARVALDWRFEMVNEICCQLLGYTEQELLGTSFTDLNPSAEHLLKESKKLLSGDTKQLHLEELYINKHNEVRWLNLHISLLQPECGQAEEFIITFEDITTQKQAEKTLKHNALYDTLTGLPNRALLRDRLKQSLARHKRHESYTCAVLFLDLDRFKTVNDSLGHMVGDKLLIEVANRLSSVLRQEDTVARWGGDEFVLLLDSMRHTDDAVEVAERLLEILTSPIHIGDHELYISTSIGILPINKSYDTTEELLRDADIAMYHAKDTGRARYAVFQDNMRQRAQKELQLDSGLRRAIERDELSIHYQPIISLDTQQLVAFEALIRWQHPEKGMISPADFLPLAEETGFICTIDQWVLQEATKQLKQWQSLPRYKDLAVSVNLSSLHFGDQTILGDIKTCLETYEISPHTLHLEITESAIVKHQNQASVLLQLLFELGTRINLDDFGTGYSSLNYLQHFPINVLKIDRSFIRELDDNPKQERLIELLIALAHTIGLKVVAEGIETKAQLNFLNKLNCDFGQGYLMGKPLDKEGATQLLKNHP